ncbi:hypothetical protein AB0L80_07620 [Streptomyces sp. NPDC052069]|uniref:hypothetical protein n=1 Tax=Streptomyces sp. NPDC052069 TaxID=3154650 RepID=UPI00344422DB
MSADFLPYMGALLVAGAAAVTWAARLAPSAGPKGTAGFSEMPPGGRYLVCAGPRCGEVLLHVPVGGGRWECTRCSTVTGGAA